MKIEIKNRWSGEVIFSTETDSWRLAVEAAIKGGVSLSAANLRAANLRAADLRDADLSDADLSNANLRNANLRDADLSDADLSNANLSNANLRNADLSDADLSNANLRAANLRAANLIAANLGAADLRAADLRDADLRDANLRDADLSSVRDDVWAVLCAAPAEVPALRDALISGRVNGSQYEGVCACLVGTLANARGCGYRAIPGLAPDSSRPSERFFHSIREGDTPENNQHAKLALEWIDQWLANMRAVGAFST